MAGPERLVGRSAVAAVALLCILPWLNPFSFGPIPSVAPWLASAVVVSAALLLALFRVRWNYARADPIWASALPLVTALIWGLWPRAAAPMPYEVLALCSALLLIVLGFQLARLSDGRGVSGQPWTQWCTLYPWLAAGLISSAFALLQYTGHAQPFMPWINWAPPSEAFANLRQRNQFASLTNIALAALLAWRVLPRCLVAPSVSAELWLAVALAWLALGNAASASRTGLVQLVLLAALAWLWRRERRVACWLGWALGCYAIGVLALPWLIGLDPSTHGMFSRLRTGDALCSSRLTLWGNVLDLIAQRPWLGWGWGELDYAHYMTLYDGPRFCDILDNAHNLPLHLAVELGIPAALLFCGLCLWGLLVQRPWRETDPMRQLAWMVLAVIALHSLLEYPLWYGPFQLACGLSLGMLWRGHVVRATAPVAPGGRAWWPAACAALLLAGCAYAAWDYQRISQIYLPPEQRLPQYQRETLAQAQRSWLFARQVRFAELSITPVTRENAAHVHALASDLLHFSPEAKVIEKLLDSARLLGRDDEVRAHAARFAAAFPQAYAAWALRNGMR